MRTNKEIITEIINDLESTIGLDWSTSTKCKINRTNLIECWSEYRKEPNYKFYGYKNNSNSNQIYRKIFSKLVENKPNAESWVDYVIRKYSYKYCPDCKNLLTTSKFQIDNSRVSLYRSNCKICANNYGIKYYNTEVGGNIRKEYRQSEHGKSIKKKYFKEHKAEHNARNKKRRLAKINRTPIWLTENDYSKMEQFYISATKLEIQNNNKYHVDHIIPLQGKLVSGLHVPSNLQVITQKENLSKSNTYIIEGI